jgi:hypothetical protein
MAATSAPAFYRPVDPLINLAVRVSLRRVTAAKESVQVFVNSEEAVVAWQEKLYNTVCVCASVTMFAHSTCRFRQDEESFYADQSNCATVVELDHHARVVARASALLTPAKEPPMTETTPASEAAATAPPPK